MKIFNILLAIIFTIFALVQYNDPDPWKWIAAYMFVALISGLAANNIYPKWIIRGGIIAFLISLGILLPDFIDWINSGAESITQNRKAEKPQIELTREFLGLLLSVCVLGFHLWQGYKKEKYSRQQTS